MDRLTKKFTDGGAYCEAIVDVGIKGVNYPTYVGKAVDKLAEYEDLEEQGLLLKLPCKVGDYIWNNDFGKLHNYEVTGFSFINLNQDEWEDVNVSHEIIIYYKNSNGSITGSFAVSHIGKTVFLTQAEAEEALKRLEVAE